MFLHRRTRDARVLQRGGRGAHRQAVRRARRDRRARVGRGPPDDRSPTGRRSGGATPRPGIAFFERRPSHRTFLATGYDGVRRLVEVTAYPLFASADDLHGVVSRLLGGPAAGRRQPDADARLGMPRLGRRAGPRHGPLRRQHLVPRGASRERRDARARRRDRHATARRGDGRERRSRALHILLTHLHLDHLQGLGFFRPLFRPDLDVHLWGPSSPVQSLADRIAMYLSPPLFPVRLADIPAHRHVPRRARGTGHDRLGDDPRREGDAPGSDGRLPHRGERAVASRTSPTTSRRSASGSPTSRRRGSAVTTSPATSTCCSTTRSTATTSTPTTSDGATRRSSHVVELRPQGRGRAGSCCSTTTRTTPTTTSNVLLEDALPARSRRRPGLPRRRGHDRRLRRRRRRRRDRAGRVALSGRPGFPTRIRPGLGGMSDSPTPTVERMSCDGLEQRPRKSLSSGQRAVPEQERKGAGLKHKKRGLAGAPVRTTE